MLNSNTRSHQESEYWLEFLPDWSWLKPGFMVAVANPYETKMDLFIHFQKAELQSFHRIQR